MKNTIQLLFLVLCLCTKAQIIYTLPEVIPEFDGSYEDFGRNHFFYPNGGEIRFANEDQTNGVDVVKYYTKFQYPVKYLLSNTNMSFVFYRTDTVASVVTDSLHRIDLSMYGRDPNAFLAEADTQKTAVLNYFTQHFGSGGRTDVRGRASMVVQNIYTKIDMIYCSNNFGTKIFYVIWPGGNPNDIILEFNGAKSTGVVGNNLVIKSNWDKMSFVRPKAYQYTLISNIITPVNVCPASWVGMGADQYGVSISGSWSGALPLVIQVSQGAEKAPAVNGLAWSTYFGGSIYDFIYKSRVDVNKNLVVAGINKSPDFPIAAGPMVISTLFGAAPVGYATSNGFVAKFDPAGVLKWVTQIGGQNGEFIRDFEIHDSSYYCVGTTLSNNLPTQAKTNAYNDASFNGTWDGFLFQLSSNGQTNRWTTYFGGGDLDELRTIRFDATDNIFVGGNSNTHTLTPFGPAGSYTVGYKTPQLSTSYDAIILKFNSSTNNIDWFTYYGTSVTLPTWGFADDFVRGMEINGTDLYITGESGGTDLPSSINSKVQTTYYDGYLAKFSTSGALVSSKFTDGSGVNRSLEIYKNKLYIVGEAHYGMNVVHSPKYYFNGICTLFDDQAFFSVHNLNIDTTYHCTYLGDTGHDDAIDIQFDNNDVFYITGATEEPYFPTVAPGSMYLDNSYNGSYDYFVIAFALKDTNVVWGTYLGSGAGFETDGKGEGATLALDGISSLYLCGATTSYTDFPLATNSTPPYFQANGATDTTQSTRNGTITKFDLTDLNIWVGIKDFPNTTFAFSLYPNPTSDFVVIDNKEFANQNLCYAIYDIQGKKIREGTLDTTKEKNINVSQLQSGTYIINVSNGKRTFSNKFIKVED